MFLLEDRLRWSASDLTAAATCEYGLLRRADHKLGWAERTEVEDGPLQEHIARMGDRHETRLLETFVADRNVARLGHIEGAYTPETVAAIREATIAAFQDEPDMVFQPALFDGEFFGYADFVERTDTGWLVCDAKLARAAKPAALLQLGAYADQLAELDLPVAPSVALLLGSGERAEFPLADVHPAFVERRARLREVLAVHHDGGTPVAWGDDRYLACGHCGECGDAIAQAGDVALVAGLRMAQRTKLRALGVHTVGDLAAVVTKPAGMAPATFDRLRSQAELQHQQAGHDTVAYRLTKGARPTLSLLPAPSEGDLFFDFEGDPLYDEGDPSQVGLEYLWGVLDAAGRYTPTWAHSWTEERSAFVQFIELATARRVVHPDMHVYHYAPYETTALKRLAMRYQTRENELDVLLRGEVFVDLYSTVRGAVQISQPSYSIKKLEPLYMGDQLRDGDVADGAGSIVAYHEFREHRLDDPGPAGNLLAALADYNGYDCLSTLRLRDWLLERAVEAGVRDEIVPRALGVEAAEGEQVHEDDPLFAQLAERSGPDVRAQRTDDEQAYALMATALDYYRRENKQFWWEHYERLGHPIEDWNEARDIFVVERAEVVGDWAHPGGRARNLRRHVRLLGDWTPGSKVGSGCQVAYETPLPPGARGPEGARYGTAASVEVEANGDPRVADLIEGRTEDETFADLPVALVPAAPPDARRLEEAIREVAGHAVASASLPSTAAMDLLARRAPRMRAGGPLPHRDTSDHSVVEALLEMDDSYVAVQGPPGTGKTYTGSQVIKTLVEEHGWRIGVVSQSHAVVEHMLEAIAEKGLSPALIAKAVPKQDDAPPDAPWTPVNRNRLPEYLEDCSTTGCVIGGTAWDFANEGRVPRGGLDLLVVDEAGQFSLAHTISSSVAARRLLLLGDPQQLPQVSQGSHAEPVDESALGWLLDGRYTIPADRGYFLADTYRMHPALCAKVSTLSYEERLGTAPDAPARHLAGVEPGLLVVTVDHTGNRTESEEEAAEVVAHVQSHLGLSWTDPEKHPEPRPLAPGDFLVVAPYNAQVACIRRQLDAAGLGEVRVGTVDKFQGQEAPISIVSMTASSPGDVPRGMGFLLNRNRVNVAVSRAQWRAILIRSTALTAYMPTTADGVLELGAFIGLCTDVSARTE